MRRILPLLAGLVMVSCATEMQEVTSVKDKIIGGESGEFEQGTLLVRLEEKAVQAFEAGEISSKDIFGELEISAMSPAQPMPKNEKVARKYGLHQWYCVTFDPETSVSAVAQKASESSLVKSVQYNSLTAPVHNETMQAAVPMTRSAAPSDLPFNDPMLQSQWNLINTGDKTFIASSVEGADVGVKDAWRLTTGDNRIVVAVIDEGVMVRHPDLVDVLWTNDLEANGEVGKDDDGNGYVDDVNGYNFFEGKGRPSATGNSQAGHGTHVAGIIAARNGNGEGVSSIAGGSGSEIYDGVRIMSCQIFRKGSKTSDRNAGNAFIYAADMGASIAQCSYGSLGGLIMSDKEYLEGIEGKTYAATYEHTALLYFMDPANRNCDAVETNIVVFAAGNNNGPASSYPGALPFCISVTAFGPDFLPGGYSNHGPGCDISAPGGDPCLGKTERDLSACILSTGVGGGNYDEAEYVYNYGTSMACPHVSGVAALGMSYALKIGKTFTREEFISKLLTSVNDIDSFMVPGSKKFYNLNSGAYDTFDPADYKGKMGTGAVDAWKFLMALEGTPVVVTKPGETAEINLEDYIGETTGKFSYTLSIDDQTRNALGIEGTPVIRDGKLSLKCTKVGSGKITVSASVGKDESREDGIGGLDFSREISIVSRSYATENGGWL